MMPKRVQVLLVDDSAADVVLMRTAMREVGLPVDLHVVGDGERALSRLRSAAPNAGAEPIELVLLDLNLPRKGGFEVLAEVRADASLAPTPVIIMTTSTADADVQEAYRLGASAFIVKPVDYDRFVYSVRTIGEFWFDVARLPRPGDPAGPATSSPPMTTQPTAADTAAGALED